MVPPVLAQTLPEVEVEKLPITIVVLTALLFKLATQVGFDDQTPEGAVKAQHPEEMFPVVIPAPD